PATLSPQSMITLWLAGANARRHDELSFRRYPPQSVPSIRLHAEPLSSAPRPSVRYMDDLRLRGREAGGERPRRVQLQHVGSGPRKPRVVHLLRPAAAYQAARIDHAGLHAAHGRQPRGAHPVAVAQAPGPD